MGNMQAARTAVRANSRVMIVGGALMAVGAVIGLAGLAVTGGALTVAIRRWVREMEEPPADLARRKWAQAKAATAAGASAWQDGNTAQPQRARM